MFRPMASVVSALSGCVANGHRVVHPSPLPPLKFRTAGFPQYGFKPAFPRDLRRRRRAAARRRPLIRGPQSACPPPGGIPVAGASRRARARRWGGGSGRTSPVQRPLAVRRVVLSRRVIAYYGLIRGSGHHPTAYAFAGGPRGAQRFPNLLRASFAPCRLPYPGGSGGRDCCSSTRGGLRPFVMGSAPAVPTQVGTRVGRVTRLQSSLDAAARSVASPPPTRTFTCELPPGESPPRRASHMATRRGQSIAVAGLSPAGRAALWAATRSSRRGPSIALQHSRWLGRGQPEGGAATLAVLGDPGLAPFPITISDCGVEPKRQTSLFFVSLRVLRG